MRGNIFTDIPHQLSCELFENLLTQGPVRIERIVSIGHCTPEGQWYDQDTDEWVMVLQGQAILLFDRQTDPVHLNTGDYLFIPAHTRHRVEWTVPETSTIWLAMHLKTPQNS